MKPFIVQLVSIALCDLYTAPCEERTSVVFVANL